MEEINKTLLDKKNYLLRQEPLVSIIVSICNNAHLLHTCIDSIIEQTYSNLEIILIDDGSTDNSPIICKNYEKSSKNGGSYSIKR